MNKPLTPFTVAIVALTLTLILFGCSLNLGGVVRVIVTSPMMSPVPAAVPAISQIYKAY